MGTRSFAAAQDDWPGAQGDKWLLAQDDKWPHEVFSTTSWFKPVTYQFSMLRSGLSGRYELLSESI